MNARNSDDDLRDFMPDMAAIRREADPAYAERKLKEALNNPELDKALAEVRALKAREGTMTANGIEAPAAPSGAARPHKAATGSPARRRKHMPAWAVYTLAVLAALVPAGLVLVLVKREPPAAQVVGSAGCEPASVNAAAPLPAVGPGEGAGATASDGARAATDTSAPDASRAIEPALRPLTPPLPGPVEAPLIKGSAPPRAGPGPKGPASGRPKPPASASPITTPVEEGEYVP